MRSFIAVVMFTLSSVSVAQIGVHPKLFFSANDIPTLQSRITVAGSDAQRLWNVIGKQRDWYMSNPHLFPENQDAPRNRYYENIPALAFSYLMTGNTLHADTARYLIFHMDSNPALQGIIYDNVTDPFGVGFRINALALTYDFMFDQLDAAQRRQIQDTIISSIGRPGVMRSFLQMPNATLQNNLLIHHALPLLLAAMSIYGENANYDTAQANVDIALAKQIILTDSNSYLKRMWSPDDGAYLEGVFYNFVGLNQVAQFVRLIERWEGINYSQQSFIRNRLSKVLDWLAYELLPDPHTLSAIDPQGDIYVNNLNDGGYFAPSPSTMLMLSALYPEKASMGRWLFEHSIRTIENLVRDSSNYWNYYSAYGHAMLFILPLINSDYVAPTSPSGILPLSKHFVNNGLVYIRTSSVWADNNDVQFAFTSSPVFGPVTQAYSVKHDHPDKNHFTLSAYGVNFIVDGGQAHRTPVNHNYVLIDGAGQPWSQQTIDYAMEREGKIVSYNKSSKFEAIHGDAKNAFNKLYWESNGIVQVDSSILNPLLLHVQNADRYVHFVRSDGSLPPYVIITDDIRRNNDQHSYAFLLNTPGLGYTTNPLAIVSGNDSLKVFFTADSTPTFGTYPNSPLLTYQIQTTAVNPHFHVMLLPTKPSLTQPSNVLASKVTNGSVIATYWANFSDYSVFRYAAGVASSSNISTDVKLSMLRVNNSNNKPASYCMTDGSSFTYASQEVINLYGVVGSVFFANGVVQIVGNVSSYRAYAPSASMVTVNGSNSAFAQVGDYVVYPPPPPPPAPQLASPANGATGVSTAPTLTWNAASGATSYRIQVSLFSDFRSTVWDSSGITSTSYAVPGLMITTTFYWRVRGSCGPVYGDWSNAWSFTTCSNIGTNTTWAGSITIPQSFTVYSNNTLTIRAGAYVKFSSGATITLWGSLSAQGTNAARITFDGQRQPNLGTALFEFVSSGGGTFLYTDVKSAKYQIHVWGNGNLTVQNCTFADFDSLGYGGAVYGAAIDIYNGGTIQGATYTVMNSSFSCRNRAGWAVSMKYLCPSSVNITGNAFEGAYAGVYTFQVWPTAPVVISGGSMTNCTYGVADCASSLAVSNVSLSNNSDGIYFSLTSGSITNCTLTNSATCNNGFFIWAGAYATLRGNTLTGPASGSPAAGNGIYIAGNSTNAIVDGQRINGFYNGVYVDWGASATIGDTSWNRFQNCYYAICAGSSAVNVDIKKNDIYSNGWQTGILRQTGGMLMSNYFEGTGNGYAINNSSPLAYAMTNSTFKSWYTGFGSSNPEDYTYVFDCNLISNSIHIRNYGSYPIFTSSDWWGTTNMAVILGHLSGNVLVYSIRQEPAPGAGPFSPGGLGKAIFAGPPPVGIGGTEESNSLTRSTPQFGLSQNFPNPFNPSTVISYALPVRCSVNLMIVDILGRETRILVSQNQSAGSHQIRWDGRDKNNTMVPSGTYIYRLVANPIEGVQDRPFVAVGKLTVIK